MTPKRQRVFGIDPGLARLGWAVIESGGDRLALVDSGCLITPAHSPAADRLLQLQRWLDQLFARFRPGRLAVEKLFFTKNVSSGILIGQARGVILAAAAKAKIPIYEFTPTAVKQAVTGYGRADKQQMQQMVKLLLHLPTRPVSDDVADAMAVAICGIQIHHLV